MKTFSVTYETRQPGAIGAFGHSVETVEIHQSGFSQADVTRQAMHQLHAQGLETRFPVRVTEATL